MTKIKENIPQFVNLTTEDQAASPTRRSEQMWQQIVGNIVSHRASDGNMIHDGYAEYDEPNKSIRITDLGIEYLKSRGH